MTPATKLQRRTFLSLVAGTPFLQGQTPDLTKPERILPLRATTAHVQGIDTDGQRLWVTAVDRPTTKGFLYQFSIKDGSLEQTVEVQDGPRYHPGGLQFHNNSLWLPVAEYRRTSTAVIQKRNAKTLGVCRNEKGDMRFGNRVIRIGEAVAGHFSTTERGERRDRG